MFRNSRRDPEIRLRFAGHRHGSIESLDSPLTRSIGSFTFGEGLGRENDICNPGRGCFHHILHGDELGNLQLRYTTRQQPVPTSRLLERALEPATANGMYTLSWSRAFGANASLDLAASYATSPYYLLMPTYVQHQDGTANQFEFEGFWSVRF